MCKCCKCYKQIEAKEQVHYEHSIYCQGCCEKKKTNDWIFIGGLIAFCVIFVSVVAYFSYKKCNEIENEN